MARTRIMGNQSDLEITMCSPQALSGEAPVHNSTPNGEENTSAYNIDSDSSSSSASSTASDSTKKTRHNRTGPIKKRPMSSLFTAPIHSRTFAQVASQSLQNSNAQELEETIVCNEDTLSYQNNNVNFPPLHENYPSMLGNKSLMQAMEETEAGDYKASYSESLKMDDDDDENGIDEPKTLQERIFQLHRSSICDDIFDLKFLIGKDKVEVDSDRLVLSTYCTSLYSMLKSDDKFQNMQPIALPTLSQDGFLGMLQYSYTDKLDMRGKEGGEALVYVASVLAAATECGCDDLIKICTSYMQRELSVETAARIFGVASAENNEQLRQMALSLIAKHPKQVFSSEEFRNLTEDALCDLLNTDGWYMKEMDVFHSVRRWAEARFSERYGQKVPTGLQLRTAMGRSFNSIRFGVMTSDEIFSGIRDKYTKFFQVDEIHELLEHHHLNKVLPPIFISRPRCQDADSNSCPSLPIETQAVQNESDRGSFTVSTEIVNEAKEEVTLPSTIEPAQPPATKKRVLDESAIGAILQDFINPDTPVAPPKKKRKRNSTAKASAAPTPSTSTNQNHHDSAKEQPLLKFIQTLGNDPDKEIFTDIHETVELTSIPSSRVYLPNLKSLHLTLKMRNPFANGSSFKSTMKLKMQSLKQLIFFDKEPAETQTDEMLGSLLNLGVNITLKCFQPESILLKIDHEKGILVLNLLTLPISQEIINGASNFPLKKLCISECDLSTLAPIRKDLLEVIVMRRVRGLKNFEEFLRSCGALKEICWNDLGNEEINFTELLKSLPQLKKFSVAKCKLSVCESGATNCLQDLFLDNCTLDLEDVHLLPALFPYLKRIHIYGKQCNSKMFCTILKMSSIERIFLWEMVFLYKKVNRKSLREEDSQKATEFLKSLFTRSYVLQEKLTFSLERKTDSNDPVPGSSSNALENHNLDLFDPTIWKGEKIVGNVKYNIISKIDFEQNSYDEFYADYHAFHFSDSTGNDMKKQNNRQLKVFDTANANSSNEEKENGSPEAVEVSDGVDSTLPVPNES